MQRRHNTWNSYNVIALAFLLILIVLLSFLSMLQPAKGKEVTWTSGENSTFHAENWEQLKAYESRLSAKEKELIELENQLSKQEDSLKDLVEVRTNIIKQLVDKFSQSNLLLEIDNQTGAIRFSDGIFFDPSEAVITTNGANYLEEFIPAYFSILLNEENRDFIAEIIVEGHTDDIGSYLTNLELSQNRALAVVRFILQESFPDFEHKDLIHSYLTANGRSYSQPIMTGGIINREKSRRVEFKFRLKDEETIKEMQQIFERTNS